MPHPIRGFAGATMPMHGRAAGTCSTGAAGTGGCNRTTRRRSPPRRRNRMGLPEGMPETAAAPFGPLLKDAAAFVMDDYPSALAARPYGLPQTLEVASYAVESSCVAPPAVIGQRCYAAYSIRLRIHRLLPHFLQPAPAVRLKHRRLVLPRTLARRQRNLDGRDLAEVQMVAQAREFPEELTVRRELAFKLAWYRRRVDRREELPEWARCTLACHRRDRRHPLYTREQFESAATADALWNATRKELRLRGTIHGYNRMYRGKKILEWPPAPEEALATMIHLHDRPWPERRVYGTVCSMSLAGVERKTGTGAYIQEIEHLERTGKETIT